TGIPRKMWCHVFLVFATFILDLPNGVAIVVVTRLGGHHVLPHQELRAPSVPPDRRELPRRRPHPPARARYPRTLGPTPALRPPRRPRGRGGALGRPGPPPARPPQGPRPRGPHPRPGTRLGLRAPVARRRLPSGRAAPAPRAPLRVPGRTRRLPHRPAPPVRN